MNLWPESSLFIKSKNYIMNRLKSLFFFFYVYSLPLFLIFCLSSCNKSQNKDAINSFEKRKREKINRYEKILVDKKIKSFEKTIKTEIAKRDYYLYFVFKGDDCGSCVINSFKMIKRLDSLMNNNVRCISINRDIAKDRFDFGNKYKIISGDTIFTNKELNVLKTPIFVLINRNYRIMDFYLPVSGLNQEKAREKFIQKVIKRVN